MKFIEIFFTALKLGLTAFGGPIAHISYFQREYVQHRKWLSDSDFADLLALSQFLPGPASSQLGMGIGYRRGGVLGAMVSWLGFTLPTAVILVVIALSLKQMDLTLFTHALHGLKVVAVAVVLHALWSMSVKLCYSWETRIISLFSAAVLLLSNSASLQFLLIVLSGALTFFLHQKRTPSQPPLAPGPVKVSAASYLFLILFFIILLLLPIFSRLYPDSGFSLFDSFYRSGSLVFGGGHVVLPLLEAESVGKGLISKDHFLAGYSLTNALPGPLFTLSAYIGALSAKSPSGILGAVVALLGIFLPAFLLMMGAIPLWDRLKENQLMRNALVGINACVVGILFSAFIQPVLTSAIHHYSDIFFAALFFLLLIKVKHGILLSVLSAIIIYQLKG